MTPREHLAKLQQEKVKIDLQVKNSIDRQMKNRDEISNAIVAILRDEKTLQRTTWRRDSNYLYAVDNTPLAVDATLDIAREGWHCISLHTTPFISLRMDDEAYWIRFDEPIAMQTFIAEWGLTISSDNIEEQLAELEKERERLLQLKVEYVREHP